MAKTRGFDSAKVKLRRMKRNLNTKPQKAALQRSEAVAAEMRTIIIANNTVASGMLLEGIGTDVRRLTPLWHRITIESRAPHSGYVEYGTGDFNLPNGPRYRASDLSSTLVTAIQRWMIEKPTFTAAPTYWRAYTIADAIANGTESRGRGTPAQPFMEPAWWTHEIRMKQDITRAVKRSVWV